MRRSQTAATFQKAGQGNLSGFSFEELTNDDRGLWILEVTERRNHALPLTIRNLHLEPIPHSDHLRPAVPIDEKRPQFILFSRNHTRAPPVFRHSRCQTSRRQVTSDPLRQKPERPRKPEIPLEGAILKSVVQGLIPLEPDRDYRVASDKLFFTIRYAADLKGRTLLTLRFQDGSSREIILYAHDTSKTAPGIGLYHRFLGVDPLGIDGKKKLGSRFIRDTITPNP
jgi:hypothetical protein